MHLCFREFVFSRVLLLIPSIFIVRSDFHSNQSDRALFRFPQIFTRFSRNIRSSTLFLLPPAYLFFLSLPDASISPKSFHHVHEARNLFGCFCPEHLYDQPLQLVPLCRGVTLRENVERRLEGIKQLDNEAGIRFRSRNPSKTSSKKKKERKKG